MQNTRDVLAARGADRKQRQAHLIGGDAERSLEQITREIEVRCLPTAIPAALDLDVSALAVGQSVHVRDIIAGDVTVLSDPDQTVATVVAPTVHEEKPAGEAVAETAAEPEVVAAKGKKEEGEDEKKDDKKEKAKA